MNNTCMPPQFIRLGSELNQHGQAALQLHASSSCPVIFQATFIAPAVSSPSTHMPAPSAKRTMGRPTETMEIMRLRIHTPSLRFDPFSRTPLPQACRHQRLHCSPNLAKMTTMTSRPTDWRGAFHPRRELGRTGFKATLLGIGDLADRKVPLDRCVATIHRAMDAGLNLIDPAPNYEDGYSEQIVGAALKGRRDGMFVIDKIDNHHEPVVPQVDASLKNTGLDTIDCFVFHGVSTMKHWRKIPAPGGGMEQLKSVVRDGKARFRGISSHHPDVLLAAIPSGLCDMVMFAVGPFVDKRYVEEILPLAKQHHVGTVCFKTFGAGKLLAETTGYNQPLQVRPRGKVSSGGNETS